ncbi:MAG: hypothetical protein ACO2ON_01655 [Candidatus Nanopusillus sp.]
MFKNLRVFNKFNNQLDRVYVIYWEPPYTYLAEAHPLLSEVFKGFIDKWTIISDNQEKEIYAIVLFYGLPITKYPKNELDPNLEHLENATSKHAYYRSAMIYLLEYLENLDYGQFKLLLDLMTKKIGVPVKVKELEGKNISLHTGVFKGKLNDIYLLIQEGKNIDITVPSGVRWFGIFGFSYMFKILGEAIKRDPRMLFFLMAGIFLAGLIIAGVIFMYKAFGILNTGSSNPGTFTIIEVNGTECIAMNGQCVYYVNPAVP